MTTKEPILTEEQCKIMYRTGLTLEEQAAQKIKTMGDANQYMKRIGEPPVLPGRQMAANQLLHEYYGHKIDSRFEIKTLDN
jgi:hypothetical protein